MRSDKTATLRRQLYGADDIGRAPQLATKPVGVKDIRKDDKLAGAKSLERVYQRAETVIKALFMR